MKTNSECIVDDNGVEILVSYQFEESDGYYEQPENIATYVPPSITNVYLTSVEVVIAGRGIDLLPKMNKHQKDFIISKLNYE